MVFIIKMRCEKVEFWWEIASDRRLMTYDCRLARQVAKCPKLRANCAFDNQTAPTTSHLGHRKATQFCR